VTTRLLHAAVATLVLQVPFASVSAQQLSTGPTTDDEAAQAHSGPAQAEPASAKQPSIGDPGLRTGLASAGAPGTASSDARERATLLAAHLPDAIQRERPGLMRVFAGAIGVLGGVAAVGAAVATDESAQGTTARERTLLGLGGGLWFAGGVATILAPDPYVFDAYSSTMGAGLGTMWFGLWSDDAHASDAYVASFVVGAYATAALSAINLMGARRTSRQQLVADYALVSNAEQRHRLTTRQVMQIEADFRGTQRLVPVGWVYLPLFVGGTTASAIALAGHDNTERNGRVLLPLIFAVEALPLLLSNDPFSDYSKALRRTGVGMRLAPGPNGSAGLGLVGWF